MAAAPQRARNNRKPQRGGRVFCVETEQEKGDDSHTVVSGTFAVNAVPVKVLFDAGATHSFINPNITARMICALEELDICLCVSMPLGSTYQTELIV